LALGTGPHYLEETHEDSYALPRGMLLMMMMMIRIMEVVVTTGAIKRAKLQSNHRQ